MKDENLFSETSMSFGEHLEELRKCLFYSIYWIAIGSIGGFIVGSHVVDYIQVPVKKSLERYYSEQTAKRIDTERKKLEEEGYGEEIATVSARFGLVPEEVYIFPGEFQRILERQKQQERKNQTDDDIAAQLFGVDNLSRQKNHRKKQTEAIFGSYDSVHLDEKPIRWLIFRKIADDPKTRTKALGVHEVFAIWIKASLLVGLVLASPMVFYHIWSFIAAGLYPHEKKYVYYFIPVSIGLFIGGALFAFFGVFQYVLDFLFMFNSWMNIDPDPRISEWIGFALMMPLGFGISFQLPLVMFALERVGIFTLKQYLEKWKISVLIIFILSLFLTPGDPTSMMMMGIPLTILFFGGIFFCWLIPRKKGLLDFDEEDKIED
ncbi:MAG: twin-arginine translocase subunit TatC [Planctomycetaceae bacterium]|nr:twin-arginine translocase subunit TatC [Planctomycetaceae bacterium]